MNQPRRYLNTALTREGVRHTPTIKASFFELIRCLCQLQLHARYNGRILNAVEKGAIVFVCG